MSAAESAPHSVEAEEGVLGSLLSDSSAWLKISELITASDFYRTDHQLIFGAIERLERDGKPHDPLLTFLELQGAGNAEAAGGLLYLSKLWRETTTSENVAQYAAHVKEKSDMRRCDRSDQ